MHVIINADVNVDDSKPYGGILKKVCKVFWKFIFFLIAFLGFTLYSLFYIFV